MRVPVAALLAILSLSGCSGGDGDGGAKKYTVAEVLDGDTIDLENGTRVRLLGIDAPERSSPAECYGVDAFNHLSSLIGASKVTLEYDLETEDAFGRDLAYVYAGDVHLNAKMLQDGAACVLWLASSPNGEDWKPYFDTLEEGADASDLGLWGACGSCDVPAFAGTAR